MKHFILFFSTFFLLSKSVDAQLVLKANPGGLLLGPGSSSVEWFVSSRFSMQADGYFLPGSKRDNIKFYGAGAGVSGRLYASDAARPTGFFVSPFVAQYWIAFDDLRSVSHQYNFVALGGQVGYQKILKETVTIEAGIGLWTGLNVPFIDQAFGVANYFGEGANVWLNLGIGLVIWKR